MKHELIGKPIYLASSLCEITIRLIPESIIETKAIQNLEVMKATKGESSLINGYFLSNIIGWLILSIKSQNGDTFKLKAIER